MYANISCVILSGGKSSRMGQNKALMKIGNQSLIEIMYGKVKGLFREILISSNSPHEYSFLNIPIVPDLVQNKGPIAGIYSGLKSAKNDRVFFISCDIPLMTPELIKSIVGFNNKAQIVAPKADGFVQELCAVYSQSLIESIEKILAQAVEEEIRDKAQGKRKCLVHRLVDSSDSAIIETPESLPGYHASAFMNMNKPEDYNRILEIYGRNEVAL